jgi:hypothetical protein
VAKPGSAYQYEILVEQLRARLAGQVTLKFDDGAQAVRRRLEHKHLNLMGLETLNKKLAAHVGKYDGVFARLCVTWHCIEHVDGGAIDPISEHTAIRVERFLHGFLFPHAIAFYTSLGLADDHDSLSAIAGYILARKLDEVTARDVARGDRAMRRLTRQHTTALLEQLEALGWLDQVPGRYASSPAWEVNPLCHRLFAERGEREARRRQEARGVIADALGESGDTRRADGA